MFKKRHIAIVIALLSVCSMMAGCSKNSDTYSAEYKDGYMRVYHDGRVQATYVEDFDEKEYSKDELKEMVDNEIAEFNEKYSEDEGMSLKDFAVEDDEARVKIEFKTIKDYILYNEKYVNSEKTVKLYVGTYEDAVKAGHEAEGKLKSPDSKGSTDVEELEDKLEDLYVVYTTQAANIRVDGKIKYYNEDVKVDDNMAITKDDGQNYFFYKLEEKKK